MVGIILLFPNASSKREFFRGEGGGNRLLGAKNAHNRPKKGVSVEREHHAFDKEESEQSFRFSSKRAGVTLHQEKFISAAASEVGDHLQKTAEAVKGLINGGKKGGHSCDKKKKKGGFFTKGGKGGAPCPGPEDEEYIMDQLDKNAHIRAASLDELDEGHIVPEHLFKPILLDDLRLLNTHKLEDAKEMNDLELEKTKRRLWLNPLPMLKWVPKDVCVAESMLRELNRTLKLKIPWTPPHKGPNKKDCEPVPEKEECCVCQPHSTLRAGGQGDQDFGERMEGDKPPAVFLEVDVGVQKPNNVRDPEGVAETKSDTNPGGQKTQPSPCCNCPLDPLVEEQKSFRREMDLACAKGCKRRRFCSHWRANEISSKIIVEDPDDVDKSPVTLWVPRQCDYRFSQQVVAIDEDKCLLECESVHERKNFSWNPRDDVYKFLKYNPLPEAEFGEEGEGSGDGVEGSGGGEGSKGSGGGEGSKGSGGGEGSMGSANALPKPSSPPPLASPKCPFESPCNKPCPSANTLWECFGNSYKSCQTGMSGHYNIPNSKGASDNTKMLRLYQRDCKGGGSFLQIQELDRDKTDNFVVENADPRRNNPRGRRTGDIHHYRHIKGLAFIEAHVNLIKSMTQRQKQLVRLYRDHRISTKSLLNAANFLSRFKSGQHQGACPFASPCNKPCPNANTLWECFGNSYKSCQSKMSAHYSVPNSKLASDNTKMLRNYQRDCKDGALPAALAVKKPGALPAALAVKKPGALPAAAALAVKKPGVKEKAKKNAKIVADLTKEVGRATLELALGAKGDERYYDFKFDRYVRFFSDPEKEKARLDRVHGKKEAIWNLKEKLKEIEGVTTGKNYKAKPYKREDPPKLPFTITSHDGLFLKKWKISENKIPVGYWNERNELPMEWEEALQEWYPVYQGEEIIHCMWKQSKCMYCNDTHLVTAPIAESGRDDKMATCVMHNPCGLGLKLPKVKGGAAAAAAAALAAAGLAGANPTFGKDDPLHPDPALAPLIHTIEDEAEKETQNTRTAPPIRINLPPTDTSSGSGSGSAPGSGSGSAPGSGSGSVPGSGSGSAPGSGSALGSGSAPGSGSGSGSGSSSGSSSALGSGSSSALGPGSGSSSALGSGSGSGSAPGSGSASGPDSSYEEADRPSVTSSTLQPLRGEEANMHKNDTHKERHYIDLPPERNGTLYEHMSKAYKEDIPLTFKDHLSADSTAQTDANDVSRGYAKLQSRLSTEFDQNRIKPENMPQPDPDPDDVEYMGDSRYLPKARSLQVQLILKAEKVFGGTSETFKDVATLASSIVKNQKTIADAKREGAELFKVTSIKKDQIILRLLLDALLRAVKSREKGDKLFMDHNDAEMSSVNWVKVFNQAVNENARSKTEGANQQAAQAAARLAYAARNHPYDVEAPATVLCRALGPEKCKEKLSYAVQQKDVDVQLALRLLRHGRAGSLCDQVGPWECHESFAKARAKGHTGIVAAIQALKRGAGDLLRQTAFAKSKAAIRERVLLVDWSRRAPKRR